MQTRKQQSKGGVFELYTGLKTWTELTLPQPGGGGGGARGRLNSTQVLKVQNPRLRMKIHAFQNVYNDFDRNYFEIRPLIFNLSKNTGSGCATNYLYYRYIHWLLCRYRILKFIHLLILFYRLGQLNLFVEPPNNPAPRKKFESGKIDPADWEQMWSTYRQHWQYWRWIRWFCYPSWEWPLSASLKKKKTIY